MSGEFPQKAMVLAAGFGKRLMPLTEMLPKPLIPVANRPLIEFSLRLLSGAGVSLVGVNHHHLGHEIPKALGDGSNFDLTLTYSDEAEILGTGGGLVQMRPFLEQDTFFLLNGDVLCGVDLRSVLEFHRRAGFAATMVVRPLPQSTSYTALEMDFEGRLVTFRDVRQAPRGPVSSVMFCGIHVLEPGVFDFLPKSGFACVNERGYLGMMRKGLEIGAFLYDGPWFDLGTPRDYLRANREILSRRIRMPQLDPLSGELLSNGVLIGQDAHIATDAVLGPEVVLGAGCEIGAGSRIARSVVWPGSRIEAGLIVEDTIVAREKSVLCG